MYVHIQCPQEPEEGIGTPGTEVLDSCEQPRGYWKRNLCLWEEQPGLLSTEPSLQQLTVTFSPFKVNITWKCNSTDDRIHDNCSMLKENAFACFKKGFYYLKFDSKSIFFPGGKTKPLQFFTNSSPFIRQRLEELSSHKYKLLFMKIKFRLLSRKKVSPFLF